MTTQVARQRRKVTPGSFHRPGWPLFALFTWYPLWWVLGISEFACLIFAVPMAIDLARRAPLRAPRGIGVWLLFVFWVVGGIVVLNVHAPGTQTVASGTRYLTFLYRLLWYVAATTALLYVINTRKELSSRRICHALGNMFAVITFGGALGAVAPHLHFRSALEYILPGAIRANGFVHQLIHPVTAQVQTFLGYEEARPSAPFAFTNEWGLAVACFLPFFVLSWCRADAGWRRKVAPFVLLVATVGVVVSLNRGLWLALGVSAVYIAVRYALLGHLNVLAALVGGVAVVGVLVAVSPLSGLIQDRLAHPDSNQGRSNLGALTVSSVVSGSPVMGFGTTRNVQGNFSSIGTAASDVCPGCSPPPLGTQGHLWLVIFSQGIVGLALYLTFFVGQFVRYLRLSTPYAIGAQTVILVHLVTMPVYDSIGPSLFAIMIAVGLLGREALAASAEGVERGPAASRPRPRFRQADTPLVRYPDALRRHRWSLAALGVIGAAAGLLFHASQGTLTVATQSVLVPATASLLSGSPDATATGTGSSGDPTASEGQTIDTYAQLVRSDAVLSALQATQPPGLPRGELSDRLEVSAAPNTRILHISFAAGTSSAAAAGVRAVTTAYLNSLSKVPGDQDLGGSDRVVVSATTVHRSRDGWIIDGASGAMLALSLGLIYGTLLGERRMRLSRVRRAASVGGLPILARISLPRDRAVSLADAGMDGARISLGRLAVSNVLAVPKSAVARSAALVLDEAVGGRGPMSTSRTALVTSSRSRLGDVARMHLELDRAGQRVTGIVLVEDQR